MDDFRTCPSASQPENGWQPVQSAYSSSRRNDAAISGVTDCPALAADGIRAPSVRFACAEEKVSWPKDRLTSKTSPTTRNLPDGRASERNSRLRGTRVQRHSTRDAALSTKPLHKIPNQTQPRATQQPTELGRDIASLQRWPLVPRIPAF